MPGRASTRRRTGAALAGTLAVLLGAGPGSTAAAQAPPPAPANAAPPVQPPPPPIPALAPYENRLIRELRIIGAPPQDEQLARNHIGSKPGQPLVLRVVSEDLKKLNRLGRFKQIDVKVQSFEDRSVALIFEVQPARIINAVQAVGNRQLSDNEISSVTSVLAGTPVDTFQLDRAARGIQDLYRKKGYYLAEVTIDQKELDEQGIVLFRIREGERVKVSDIRFESVNETPLSFSTRLLRPVIHTKVAGIFETGPLDDETLDRDVSDLIAFYQDRGYLDVRVDRQLRPSPNGKEAIVTFVFSEGPLYTLRSVRARLEAEGGGGAGEGKPPTVFSQDQIAGLMTIKPGDAYSVDKIRKSVEAVRDAYGKLGYIDARISRAELRDTTQPQVDLLLTIFEGKPVKTGLVIIKGDDITAQRVIRRQIPLKPDRPLDGTALKDAQERLEETQLFQPGSAKLTIQPPNPADPEHRDVLVEIKETNTGRLSFGAGISSDAGVIGSVSLNQRNFDVADFPESFSELLHGQAFRGAGQTFDITAAPGTQTQTYSISLTEPYLFETDNSGSATAFYRTRIYDEYDERRLGAALSLGRRFGDRWVANITTRVNTVELTNINAIAPVDVFDVQDSHLLTGMGLSLSRTTSDNRFRPSRGTRMDFGVEQVGAFGGDFTFTRLTAEYILYVPVYEDFLGKRTVLSFKTAAAYIPQDASEVPVYERVYLGGRSFRGFRFRTVSPKGIRNDTMTLGEDPVGGTWSFFFGSQLEHPLFEKFISGVVFIDTGTVTDSPGFSQYRVSAGVGLRLYISGLSPIPLAFDFGFPILKQDGDRSSIFSFSLDVPFN